MIETILILCGFLAGSGLLTFGIMFLTFESNRTRMFSIVSGVVGIIMILMTFSYVGIIEQEEQDEYTQMNCLEKRKFVKEHESFMDDFIVDCMEIKNGK